MGNTKSRNRCNSEDLDTVCENKGSHLKPLKQLKGSFTTSFGERSCASLNSCRSNYSVSRPWSRVSRRRWKESTLTLTYESSKTAWPVSQLESYFLPEFPVVSCFNDKKFEILEEISKGAFGRVYKVRNSEKENTFALKILSKSKIISEYSVQQVKDEVHIQRLCGHHPYIASYFSHWQSKRCLYIGIDFIGGGELYTILKRYYKLPVALVKVFTAQIALALDFLHNAGVIYRDLKPENILLDDVGNIQLIDFGLSKWLPYGSTTKTICGTLAYMAPEILTTQPYGHAVDWWSLGVIACIMLTGKCPSPAIDSSTKLAATRKPGSLPDNIEIDMASKDILQRLLELDPTRRLRSFRALETTAFFKDFNVKDILEKKVKPNDLLKLYFPNGPHNTESPSEENFENFDRFDVCDGS